MMSTSGEGKGIESGDASKGLPIEQGLVLMTIFLLRMDEQITNVYSALNNIYFYLMRVLKISV